ncbi:DNA repair protein RecN [Deinococcus peraridilitoris]|uniref:DNA repair protein RecN n=1 Tax=Deinococcus peraridilitoris (strain DSM 19664 / LMG 22246 / CIP 109416 / KR-200) TaxID=937777 RepID=L0A6X5_DEIPD|nr:DNA repair protein RecN [Deinococcus peraridilitoris]AFZ68800.1 ATPase involved in DNA repair [Deinococcus peraridilitoris DSM 19664]
MPRCGPPYTDRVPRLHRLEIQRLATIERLDLDLGNGFNVFTGETGAGKSIIVDALGLLLGTRGGSDLVRSGAEDLLVSGFWSEDVASRRVTAAGRSTARLQGEVVSLRELGEWTTERLTIHWQHSAQSLLSPAHQRAMLDRTLKGSEMSTYQAAYGAWRSAQERLEQLRLSERERARQIDLLEYQLNEIETVSPVVGEEEPLEAQLTRLSNLEAIAQGAAGAIELLSDAEVNAQGLVAEAIRSLGAAAKYDANLAALQDELRTAYEALKAVSLELTSVAEDNAPDPEDVARIETRITQLSKLRAKYGPSLKDVLNYGAEIADQLTALRRDEHDASSLEGEVNRLAREVKTCGETLGRARAAVAPKLARNLQSVVRELGMPHARLEFALSELAEPAPYGLENVELRFSANPGESLGHLADVASGGELSRVMLAVSTVLGADTPSVVFDEVDAGVGGAAANAVAAQLAQLALERQVLVVTHLAQIAARADHHYKVEKYLEGGRTLTRVRALNADEREAEIARMLSGTDSAAAREHARELLGALS